MLTYPRTAIRSRSFTSLIATVMWLCRVSPMSNRCRTIFRKSFRFSAGTGFFWLLLLVAVVAVIAFVWAVRSGQMDDLETPALRLLQRVGDLAAELEMFDPSGVERVDHPGAEVTGHHQRLALTRQELRRPGSGTPAGATGGVREDLQEVPIRTEEKIVGCARGSRGHGTIGRARLRRDGRLQLARLPADRKSVV